MRISDRLYRIWRDAFDFSPSPDSYEAFVKEYVYEKPFRQAGQTGQTETSGGEVSPEEEDTASLRLSVTVITCPPKTVRKPKKAKPLKPRK